MVRYWAVVPAAGRGARMGSELPKQYLELHGATVIEHTLARLCNHPALAGVAVVVAPDDAYWDALRPRCRVPLYTVHGGEERCHSVLNGLRRLAHVADPMDWVLVHDAARPCLRGADLDRLISELQEHPVGGLLALPVSDTVKRADRDGTVLETVSRSHLWRALTPQMFHLRELTQALEAALARHLLVTDEASAMELYGRPPRVVAGHADNIKITHPQDLPLAELFLAQQARHAS
jgi:2-C-methyl-D-erythritol 4-phosphate cytidylyltransferase